MTLVDQNFIKFSIIDNLVLDIGEKLHYTSAWDICGENYILDSEGLTISPQLLGKYRGELETKAGNEKY